MLDLSDEDLQAQAQNDYRFECQQYFIGEKRRLEIAEMRRQREAAPEWYEEARGGLQHRLWAEEHFAQSDPLVKPAAPRSLVDQLWHMIERAARSRASLEAQLTREREAIAKAVPRLKEFLSKLEPENWEVQS